MEKLLQINNITQIELISYFSSEIFCLLGILINVSMFLFLTRKFNIKRLSDLITFGAFSISSLICIGIFIKNKIVFEDFSFSLMNENLFFNNSIFFLKGLIYAFFACFVLCTYKLTRNARFKGTISNSSLLFCAITSSILLNIQNGIIGFLFLDLIAFYIYKFASSLRIKKYELFSPDFILIGATSTILFYSFCLLSYFIKQELQLSIIQTCATCALLLKIGLFPIYNYTLNQNAKKNLTYSMLLFGFLPYLGVFAFIKFMQHVNTTNEIFLISIYIFLLSTIITSALNIIKTKNLITYGANLSILNCSFYAIVVLFTQNYQPCINSLILSLFVTFAFYSLITILKINLKPEKLNMALLQNLFIKNPLFCNLFTLILLFSANVVPNYLFFNNLEHLKEIYTFDKIGFWAVSIFLFSNVLIILKTLNIIRFCYTKKKFFKVSTQLIKRTTPNYVVPIAIILLLILLLFL